MKHNPDYSKAVQYYQYNIVTQTGEALFTTIRDIKFVMSDGTLVFIPKGYETDLASVPRFLWSFVPPFGEYTFAAIIHDFLYDHGLYSKKFADREFRYIMKYSNVGMKKRFLMYNSVKFFGKGSYEIVIDN